MSCLIEHMEKEFQIAGWKDGPVDEMQELVMSNVRDLIIIFSEQGHSGMSANYVRNLFNTIANYGIIKPLTGEDDEWSEDIDGKGTYQNKRASHVFKKNGKAYDINGKVFTGPDGCSYTNKDSFVDITFPYTPTTKYINVNENGDEINE